LRPFDDWRLRPYAPEASVSARIPERFPPFRQ